MFIVSGDGVQLIVMVNVEPTVMFVIAAVRVAVSPNVVELYVTGREAVPAVAVQLELNPFVELAKEIGAAVFW